jgi:hypothetical protein
MPTETAKDTRSAFLIESFRSAHNELLLRIKQREEWLKIGLATQVVILAAMSGFEVFGTKTLGGSTSVSAPPSWLPLISMPIALIIALLYNMEERMIGHIASYLGETPRIEAAMTESKWLITTFNSSSQLRESVPGTLCYRGVTNVIVFIFLPGLVTILAPNLDSPVERNLRWLDIPLACAILFIIVASWRYRLSILKPSPEPSAPMVPNRVGRHSPSEPGHLQ